MHTRPLCSFNLLRPSRVKDSPNQKKKNTEIMFRKPSRSSAPSGLEDLLKAPGSSKAVTRDDVSLSRGSETLENRGTLRGGEGSNSVQKETLGNYRCFAGTWLGGYMTPYAESSAARLTTYGYSRTSTELRSR